MKYILMISFSFCALASDSASQKFYNMFKNYSKGSSQLSFSIENNFEVSAQHIDRLLLPFEYGEYLVRCSKVFYKKKEIIEYNCNERSIGIDFTMDNRKVINQDETALFSCFYNTKLNKYQRAFVREGMDYLGKFILTDKEEFFKTYKHYRDCILAPL